MNTHFHSRITQYFTVSANSPTHLIGADTHPVGRCRGRPIGRKRITIRGKNGAKYQSWEMDVPRPFQREFGMPYKIGVATIVHYLSSGEWVRPPLEIDHIDRNSLNNRPHNLRKSTKRENIRNRGVSCATPGVSWGPAHRAWRVVIPVPGLSRPPRPYRPRGVRCITVGYYADHAEASAIAREAFARMDACGTDYDKRCALYAYIEEVDQMKERPRKRSVLWRHPEQVQA